MTNAELIAELRGHILSVPLTLLHDAADALEAAEAYEEAWTKKCERLERRIAELEAQLLLLKEGEWIMDEHPHDGDCRCSVCLVAIDAMHERNHGLLNALTGGKWWKFYKYCPNCGARMKGERNETEGS